MYYLSNFLNGHLRGHSGFYDLVGKQKLDYTHAELDLCLTTITNHISHFHLKLHVCSREQSQSIIFQMINLAIIFPISHLI